jgi:hypothetical protein
MSPAGIAWVRSAGFSEVHRVELDLLEQESGVGTRAAVHGPAGLDSVGHAQPVDLAVVLELAGPEREDPSPTEVALAVGGDAGRQALEARGGQRSERSPQWARPAHRVAVRP